MLIENVMDGIRLGTATVLLAGARRIAHGYTGLYFYDANPFHLDNAAFDLKISPHSLTEEEIEQQLAMIERIYKQIKDDYLYTLKAKTLIEPTYKEIESIVSRKH